MMLGKTVKPISKKHLANVSTRSLRMVMPALRKGGALLSPSLGRSLSSSPVSGYNQMYIEIKTDNLEAEAKTDSDSADEDGGLH